VYSILVSMIFNSYNQYVDACNVRVLQCSRLWSWWSDS